MIYYNYGYTGSCCYYTGQININNSYANCYIKDRWSEFDITILTGNYYPYCFITKRIIVI